MIIKTSGWVFVTWLLLFHCLAASGIDRKLPPHLGLAQGYTVLPFVKAGNLILVDGRIGDETGSFILDTGAPYLVLNSTYFGGSRFKRKSSSGIAGGSFSVGEHWVDSLEIGALKWEKLKADVAPLGNVENAKGVKILGLLGVKLFEDYELVINYYINQLYLCPVGKAGQKLRDAKLTGFVQTGQSQMTVSGNVMMLDALIDGKRINTTIDTGAESCVLDNRLPNKIIKHVNIRRSFAMQGVGGGRVEVLSGILDQMILQDHNFDNLQVVVTSLEEMGKAYGTDVDMMLGYSWLSRQVTSFNFRSGEIGYWQFEGN